MLGGRGDGSQRKGKGRQILREELGYTQDDPNRSMSANAPFTIVENFYCTGELGGSEGMATQLLQLRVLCLGFLQDGDIGVGVFPQSKEVLIGTFCLGGVVREGVGAGQTQVRQCADWLV